MHSNQVKAFGTFIKREDVIYRTSAYIQWGESTQSLGACLLLNPGSAILNEDLNAKLHSDGSASGLIQTEDPTMQQLIQIVEEIYNNESNLSGRLYIHNLFNLKHGKNIEAIERFEELCLSGLYTLDESLVPIEELKLYPWILLGWGVENRRRWKNLQRIKEEWIKRISKAGLYSFGKKKEGSNDYYHPCPLKVSDRPIRVKEIISLYKKGVEPQLKQEYKIQRFSIHATKPNLIVEMNELEGIDEHGFGWSRSLGNPENIVIGFSQLGIKDGYKLRAYQYIEGGNGNGIVWAIPSIEELPDPRECNRLEDYFLSPPKPEFALDDFMEVIEGDRSPLSYLQATIAYHELHEYGAMWHGVSWGRDEILPVEKEREISSYEWEMEEEEPKIIEPHFYINNNGNPVVILYTINDIGTVTLNRYEHVFNKDNYTLCVNTKCIATAGAGIIF
ncbi:hypothetical protein PY093_20150 [Cytobacillus sp. S13-E01]|uniref:hypothetical protein n=1 Tax=Cytobacillus sp. S13-E01 TaxID=3031326 RepID=UPI0023D8A334|nr:hypothetical protein [Cytobacillus sp. S13-E01]MDF0728928.1 hypothetical protein [Cytobacillus sp. S13-E01]